MKHKKEAKRVKLISEDMRGIWPDELIDHKFDTSEFVTLDISNDLKERRELEKKSDRTEG